MGTLANLTLALLLVVPAVAVELMLPGELTPGMKGYGLSVFSGQRPERFEVEIIDVMPDIIQKRDMILFRASGMGLEKSGIISGMSGSPVYVDGKLIGAVAYGWNFAKEPIGGIESTGHHLDRAVSRGSYHRYGTLTPGGCERCNRIVLNRIVVGGAMHGRIGQP